MTHYTSIEQAKHLIKLGLNPNTADMYWSRCTITDFSDGKLKVSYAVEPCNISQAKHTKDDISCWSLGALLEAMPKEITDEYDSKGCLGMSTLYNSSWGWVIYYSNADADCQALHEEQADTLLEATYNMVIWLLEEGYIE